MQEREKKETKKKNNYDNLSLSFMSSLCINNITQTFLTGQKHTTNATCI